ncbi:MAG: hypothetical protein ACKOWP_04610 [Microbacteriaceae bacterium]
MNSLLQFAAETHGEGLPFWEEVWSIVADPAHITAELVWNVVFDVLFVSVLYGIVFKRLMLPRLRRQIHREIDEEHGIEPHDELDHSDHDH